MSTFLLAYRNNDLWTILADDLMVAAKYAAEKDGLELVVKIFSAGTSEEEIEAWATENATRFERQHSLLDNTVAKALRKVGDKFFQGKMDQWLRNNRNFVQSTEDTYKTVFERLANLVRPEQWVIVSDNITDYNPLEGEQTEESYVERFKGFIPNGAEVIVCGKHEFTNLGLADKKVIVFCHHHAAPMCDYGKMRPHVGKGSMIFETAMEDMMRQLVGVIDIADLIHGDVIGKIRQNLLSGIN